MYRQRQVIEMPEARALDGSELVMVEQDGVSRRAPASAFIGAASGTRVSLTKFGVRGDGSDEAVALQAALDSGEPLLVPIGIFASSVRLGFPSGFDIEGVDNRKSIFQRHAGMALNSDLFGPKVFSTTSGDRLCVAPKFRRLGFIGSGIQYPLWLSTAAGVPVTNPEADYAPGGVLAAVPGGATATATVSGGRVTAITVTNGGAGYLVPPVVIVEGDGWGCSCVPVLTAGAITSIVVADGGIHYTAATVRIVGGGQGPAALITADRRNVNYIALGNQINFLKCIDPLVEDCWFSGYDGNQIADSGSLNGQYRDNDFEGGGQPDFVGSAIWAGGFRPPGSPLADAQITEGAEIRRNRVRNWKRSAVTWRAVGGGTIADNVVDGFGESALFCAAGAGVTKITGNTFKNSVLTDIISSAIEVEQGNGPYTIQGNHFEDIDGWAIDIMSRNIVIEGNTFVRCPSWRTLVVPYGPFSERYGFAPGAVPTAGAQRPAHVHVICILDVDSSPDNAPFGIRITGNTFVEDRDAGLAPKSIIGFIRGAANAIADLIIEGNDLTQVTNGTPLYDADEFADCVDATSQIVIRNNLGVDTGGDIAASEVSILSPTTTLRTVQDKLNEWPALQDRARILGSGDESALLVAATAAAAGLGEQRLWVQRGLNVSAPTAWNLGSVKLLGDGAVTAYRKSVIPLDAAPPALTADVVPALHLRRFAAAISPLVVLMGDSTGVGADSISEGVSLAGLIRAKIRRDNPGVVVRWLNYSIRGASISDLDSLSQPALTLPSWYTTGQSWLWQAEQQAPDLVIVMLGTNAPTVTTFARLDSIRTKMAAWAKQPDIVWVTPSPRTLNADVGSTMKTTQEQRDLAAGNIRTFAWWRGHGLLDFHRAMVQDRDGFDPRASTLRRVLANVVTQWPWTAPAETRDFDLSFSFDNTGNARLGTGYVLRLPLCQSAGCVLLLSRSVGGFWAYQVTAQAGLDVVPATISTLSVVDGINTVQVAVRAGHLAVRVSGEALFDAVVARDMALFTPTLAYNGVYAPDVVPMTVVAYCESEHRPVMPSMMDGDLNGAIGGVYGGNGVNHPASRAVSGILQRAVDAVSFAGVGAGVVRVQRITAAGAINLDAGQVQIVGPASSTYAITLAAPRVADAGRTMVITMASTTGSNAVTLALTNVIGGSAATTASWNAAEETLVLVAAGAKWVVMREVGVTLS